jgi:hypothetical protein
VGVRSREMPGSLVAMPPCVIERSGAKRGGCDRPVRNVSEARASVVTAPSFGMEERVPSRFVRGEGHGRRLGSRSGR